VGLDMTPVNIIAQYSDDWLSALVVNNTVVSDPTVRQPDLAQ